MAGLSQYDPGQELSSIDFSGMIGGPLGAIVDAQSKAALTTVDFIKSIGFTPDVIDDATGDITPGTPVYVSFKYPKMVQPYQPVVLGAIDTVTVKTGGTGYVVGDVLTVSGITVTVASLTGSAIATIAVSASGGGHTAGTDVAATGGSGSGATFDITTKDIAAVPPVFEEMQLEVPILTMMPIPFIRVEEGEINFNAKITSMEYGRVASEFKLGVGTSMTNKNTNQNLSFLSSLNYNKNVNTVNLKTNLSYQRNSRKGFKIDKTFHLGVKITVSQDEIPEGMEKLLGILEDAIISTPVTP